MTNRNRTSESGRFRSAYDDDDERSGRRLDHDDDGRREDPSERGLGRDDAFRRGGRSYAGPGQSERWEQGGSRRYGTPERENYSGDYNQNRGYGNLRGGQDYGRDDGGQGSYNDQDFDRQRYGRQEFGRDLAGQRYGGHDYAGGRYGGQDFGQGYGVRDYAGQRYGGQDFGSQRYGGRSYAGQRYGGQEREGQYGRSENTPQYGAFGITESGRQGREWQRFGLDASQHVGGAQRGEQRGKGPKGYKRSDDRIREDVCDRLSDDDELDASEITVAVKDGEVTLEGTVNDRRAKQRAEDLAESVGGVRDVDNKLRKNKGVLQEVSEKLSGTQSTERGYSGSGTKNTPPNASMSR